MKTAHRSGPFAFTRFALAVRLPLLEALAAINRFVAARLERHFGRPSALAANGLIHLALASTATAVSAAGVTAAATAARRSLRFARSSAIRAPVRFILEAFRGEKLLLSGAKGELRVAVRAG